MKHRCFNEKDAGYKNYGGRGITVCKEWLDFVVFKNWALSNGYNKTLTIDRINNDGNYEPSNCRWADKKTQANNTRRNKIYEFNGDRGTVAFFAEKYNKTYANVIHRLKKGYPIEAALFSTPQTGPKAKEKILNGTPTRRIKNPIAFKLAVGR